MTCLKALRDAEMAEVQPAKAYKMNRAADYLYAATRAFCNTPDTENMTRLNAAWIRAKVALDSATPTAPITPHTDAGSVPEQERNVA